LNHYRWNLLPPVPVKHPATESALPPLITQLLYNRGITEESDIELFINADSRLSHDPCLLPDIHPAIARIYRALLSSENIAVYGDFDVDGISGAALLTQGLSALDARVTAYIPHRIKEGHGLNAAALERLQQQGVSLVITVDCGITGIDAVRKANKNGLDIIITDHHMPLEELPPAIAVIDPKRANSGYPFADLSGVGVAFKLLQALYKSMGKEGQLARLIDLVALGTVADMMPMLGENRYLVRQGLELLNTSPRMGIRQMAALANLNIGSLDAEDISWTLAPRLNAAGRLENAMASYNLLTTDLADEAYRLALQLEETNAERQKLTASALSKARQQVLGKGITPLLITGDRDYPGGVLGLVAGKLSNEFYRPSIAVRIDGKYSSASCRSIPEFDIIQAISSCSDLLTRFGGHPQAAGFSLPTENLPHLEQRLCRLAAAQLDGLDLRPHLDIDAEVILDDFTGETFGAIQLLAPFGKGNQLPVFLSRGVRVADCQLMGNNGNHLRLKLKQSSVLWNAVAFGLGDRRSKMQPVIDIVYNVELNRWGGEERLRLNILDMADENQAL
jgi:single-stranded-DNA-specific exonuclease